MPRPETIEDLCAECAPDGMPHEDTVTHCEACGLRIIPMPSLIGATR